MAIYSSRFFIDSYPLSVMSTRFLKTAYEIVYGLVGSEMCIRDRISGGAA